MIRKKAACMRRKDEPAEEGRRKSTWEKEGSVYEKEEESVYEKEGRVHGRKKGVCMKRKKRACMRRNVEVVT